MTDFSGICFLISGITPGQSIQNVVEDVHQKVLLFPSLFTLWGCLCSGNQCVCFTECFHGFRKCSALYEVQCRVECNTAAWMTLIVWMLGVSRGIVVMSATEFASVWERCTLANASVAWNNVLFLHMYSSYNVDYWRIEVIYRRMHQTLIPISVHFRVNYLKRTLCRVIKY